MTVGILGGGQLGRMLVLAGYPLGLRFRVLDTYADAPAGEMADLTVGKSFADPEALEPFIADLALVTYEFENVPVDTACFIDARVPVFPPPEALEVSQDRLAEKVFFRSLDIPTPNFSVVDSREALEAALERLGTLAVLKTRRLGYDGKGQRIIQQATDVQAAWNTLQGQPLILESFVPFDREVSLLSVRGRDGATAFYPLVENVHHKGILRRSNAPAPDDFGLNYRHTRRRTASGCWKPWTTWACWRSNSSNKTAGLLANEMAPRVHNSGHWTIEGAETSQFENHLRAVLGLPLGSTAPRGHAVMLNLIGDRT